MSQTRPELRAQWNKENMVAISVHMSRKRDAAIIDWWRSLPDKADTFRRMCEKEMNIKEEER